MTLISLTINERVVKGGSIAVLETPWRAQYLSPTGKKVLFPLSCLQVHGLRKAEDSEAERIIYCQFEQANAIVDLEGCLLGEGEVKMVSDHLSGAATRAPSPAEGEESSESDSDDQVTNDDLVFTEVEFRFTEEKDARAFFDSLTTALGDIDQQLHDDMEEASDSDASDEQ